MYSSANFYKEENTVVKEIDWMVKNADGVFQFIILNDDDENYIPQFAFDYITCDCNENINLTRLYEWDYDKPIIFLNTSNMLEQFKKLAGNIGAGVWAEFCFQRYKDLAVSKKKSKFIFIIKRDKMEEILENVNRDFMLESLPIYMNKNKESVKKKILIKN